MKYLLILLVFGWSDFDVNRIANINKLKNEAETAFLNEDYQGAVEKYLLLTDSLRIQDENVLLNLSNAYFELKDSANAQSNYQKLVNSSNREIRSKAFQQLGVLADQKNQLPVALDMFKESLKSNPGNEAARFNYELVKKKLENQANQEQQDQEQNNEDQEKENQEKEENEEQNKDQEQQEQENQQEQGEQEQEQAGAAATTGSEEQEQQGATRAKFSAGRGGAV